MLVDSLDSGVAVYRPVEDGQDFIFVEFNRAAEQIEKISSEDVIGKRLSEVFPGVIDFGLLEVFRDVLKTGQPCHHPVAFYQDGRVMGWKENYVYRLPSGEIVAIYRDLTKQKRVEKDKERALERVLMFAEKLRVSKMNLSYYMDKVVTAREDERRKVLYGLHARLQTLRVSIDNAIQKISDHSGPLQEEGFLLSVKNEISAAIDNMCELTLEGVETYISEETGFKEALNAFFAKVFSRSGLKVVLHLEIEPFSHKEKEIFLLRIIQELVRDAEEFSAKNADITVRRIDGYIEVLVKDDAEAEVTQDYTSRRRSAAGFSSIEQQVIHLDGESAVEFFSGHTLVTVRLPNIWRVED